MDTAKFQILDAVFFERSGDPVIESGPEDVLAAVISNTLFKPVFAEYPAGILVLIPAEDDAGRRAIIKIKHKAPLFPLNDHVDG